PIAYADGDRRWVFVSRGLDFWTNRLSLLTPDGIRPVPMPETASAQDVLDGRLIVQLNAPLEAGGRSFPNGALVAYPLDAVAAGGEVVPELVMAPDARQAIEEVSAAGGILWVKALEDVSGRLFALTRNANGSWVSRPADLAGNSTIHIQAAGEGVAFATVEG